MITDMRPVSLVEVKEIVKNVEEKKNLEDYLKKFCKSDKNKAESLSQEIGGLGNLKINETHVVKIVDFLPKNSEEINKIFNDVSLSEEEVNALLEITKKY